MTRIFVPAQEIAAAVAPTNEAPAPTGDHASSTPSPDRLPPAVIGQITLTGESHTYLTRSLRLTIGDEVTVFDGRDREYPATIKAIDGKTITLSVHPPQQLPPLEGPRLVLVQAMLKSSKMELVVQKATELGVNAIVPATFARSVPKLTPARAQKRRRRWEKIAVSACSQCGRAALPTIHPIQPDLTAALSVEDCRLDPSKNHWAAVCHSAPASLSPSAPTSVSASASASAPASVSASASASAPASDSASASASPSNPPTTDSPSPLARPGLNTLLPADFYKKQKAVVIVGPEGGLTSREVETAKDSGYRVASLGRLILRSETAAIVALTLLAAHAKRFD